MASTKIGEVLVISPNGRLDGATAPGLQDHILAKIEAGDSAVLLEMSALSYISSAGLRAILVAAKRLQKNDGRFALCGLTRQVAEVFEVTGFDAILDIHPDQATALAAMG